MTEKKVDIEQIKDKLKFFSRKGSEKLKELGEEIKTKLEERAKKAEEDDGSIEIQAPAGQKQPKNRVDTLLEKLPTLSINIGKGKEELKEEEKKEDIEAKSKLKKKSNKE